MTAWMFPGQGAQKPGMGRDLLQTYPAARAVLAEAEKISQLSLDAIRTRGPLDALTRVECLEPLLTAIAIGYAQTLIDAGIRPSHVAGYSAGEVPALFVAGALTRSDALKVAAIRGQVLSGHIDENVRMVAVSRVDHSIVRPLVDSLCSESDFIQVAGFNAPDHVTIVGDDDAVRTAESLLVADGAETTEVSVSGMWHSSRSTNAAKELHTELKSIAFTEPDIPLLTSASGQAVSAPDQLRQDLADQIAMPVQWQTIVGQLRMLGVSDFVEVGTGRTLMGILRRNWPEANEYTVTSVEGRAGNIKPLKRILSSLTP